MTLKDEVDEQRRSIHTDGYPMSINELATMYKDGELDLRPEFQRYFRWTELQKSRLVESLLLGIPIPSIFVHQRDDGIWDVVDGLQRLSSIFEVMGILKDEKGNLKAPLKMVKTKYLPSLAGKGWGANDADPDGIGGDFQRILKRSKLDIKIVLRESDSDTRLDLFQRLNSGGTALSRQELRNCILLMVSSEALQHISEMSEFPSFVDVVAVSDRNIKEQYDKELVVRFLVLRNREVKGLQSLHDFLDEEIAKIADNNSFDWEAEKKLFKETFSLLSQSVGLNAFRKCNTDGGSPLGGFVVSLFEVIALGLAHALDNHKILTANEITKIHKDLWSDQDFLKPFRGRPGGDRLSRTLTIGRDLFGN